MQLVEEYTEAQLAAIKLSNKTIELAMLDRGIEIDLQAWRRSPLYRLWKIAVILNGDRICACCENKKELHAHHIKSAAFYPELRFIVENGICICNDCHKYLHNDINGSYGNEALQIHTDILLRLRHHRRKQRKFKERLLRSSGLKVI